MKLRPIEPEDLDFLYSIENDRELWTVTNSDAPYSRYALKQYIASMSSVYACGELRLIIEIEDEDGKWLPVGMADLMNFSPVYARAEVGIALLNAYRGRGYGQKAMSLLEQLAKDRLRVHSLYAFAAQGNVASCRMFERLGYEAVATLPDWLYESGNYQPATFFLKVFQKK